MPPRHFPTLALAAVFSLPTAARGFCRTTTTGSQPVSTECPLGATPLAWRRGCTGMSLDVTVIPDNLQADRVRAAIAVATLPWSNARCSSGGAPGFEIVPFIDCANGVSASADGPTGNTVVFRRVWGDTDRHRPGTIAVTTVTFNDRGDIIDTDLELNSRSEQNSSGFVFTLDPPGTIDDTDLPTILLHEFGHAQGLAHSGFGPAVMFAVYDRVAPRRALTDDDREGICTVYPGGRGDGGCDPVGPRGHPCVARGCSCSAAPSHAPRTPTTLCAMALALTATRYARSLKRR